MKRFIFALHDSHIVTAAAFNEFQGRYHVHVLLLVSADKDMAIKASWDFLFVGVLLLEIAIAS